MITEQDREKTEIQKLENGIRFCEEAITKSEKYERLEENQDWKEFWKDIEILIGVHDKEILMGISMLPDAPNNTVVKTNDAGKQAVVSSKQDWMDFIIRHEIQRDELKSWMKEPLRILELARQARERLPELREKRKRLNHAEHSD